MSRRDSKVEKYDTLSSGDSNQSPSKQKIKEVNNNEVDELSKELSKMGCIVDAVKRPPNICVETCVYDGEDEDAEVSHDENEEDGYSDEFEEDKSEEDDTMETASAGKNEIKKSESKLMESSVKLSKSHPDVCPTKPCSVSGRSGTSNGFGTSSVPRTRRVNMSFTNERLREIERHNNILLGKILSARNSTKTSIPKDPPPVRKPVPAAAVMRKKQQRKIDQDNLLLLKKIQRAKSSSYSVRR